MALCPICGKKFEENDVEDYIGKLFGYDAVQKIWDDTGKICDSCCISVYYADHPNVNK